MPVIDKGHRMKDDLRLDLLVEVLVVVECRATTAYNKIFEAQLPTCLRLLDLRMGLIVNFGERLLRNGFHRVVNGL